MNKQEITQFKVLSLSAVNGDLEKAKLIYEWLSEDSFEAEVERLVAQKQVKIEADWIQKQLDLFAEEPNGAE